MHETSAHALPGPYRTVVISDAHLGTRDCRSRLLGDFLASDSLAGCTNLVVVGDLIDGWRLRRTWSWTDDDTRVLRKIVRLNRKGTAVVYVPGNHDEFLRELLILLGRSEMYVGNNFRIVKECIHITADGKKLLVIHGDEFDGLLLSLTPWLSHLGDHAYTAALWLNRQWSKLCRLFGYRRYWSLSHWLKSQVKSAVQFVARYSKAVAARARAEGVDGVICGHIHTAEISIVDGVIYMNAGDWVESCTALVEHPDGRWEIVTFSGMPSCEQVTTDPRDEEESDALVEVAAGLLRQIKAIGA